MWNIARDDEHFLIHDDKRLEGVHLQAHSGREGIHLPEEIFTADAPCWEANRLNIRYE